MGQTFSSRLRVWLAARQSGGEEWTPKRLEQQTGIARAYWSYWLSADEREAKGEKVVACHRSPSIAQLQRAIQTMPAEFGAAFALPQPKPLALRDSRLRCLWCGEPTNGRDHYCCDWHYGMGKIAQRQAARKRRQVAAG